MTEQKLSPVERRRSLLERLQRDIFDLLVIGGGITGAGVARDAALRGLTVALLEKGDFGSGTSSRSSRMVHGGLRYLRHGQVRLVREALQERASLLQLAPHLVRPQPFLLPVHGGFVEGRATLKLGLTAYDAMGGKRAVPGHRWLSREALLREAPGLGHEGLRGGFRYYDCLTPDARLTLTTVRGAEAAGAVALNYTSAIEIRRRERHTDVRFQDRLAGDGGIARARQVIVAAGPWTDAVREGEPAILRPTKGIHAVLKPGRLPVASVVILQARDGRMLFAVPWAGTTYLGTTDTDYPGDPDAATADASDIDYLLTAANDAFPDATLRPVDIMSTWAGVRPLVAEEGQGAPSDVSRDYEIVRGPEDVLAIAGGKLTTYRAMAEAIVDRALKEAGGAVPPCRTAQTPLPGAPTGRWEPYVARAAASAAERYGIPLETAERLVRRYGNEHESVFARAGADRSLLESLPNADILEAEVAYTVEQEAALTLEDVMIRRTDLMLFEPGHGMEAAPRIAAIMAERLEWTQAEADQQVRSYRQAVARMLAGVEEAARTHG